MDLGETLDEGDIAGNVKLVDIDDLVGHAVVDLDEGKGRRHPFGEGPDVVVTPTAGALGWSGVRMWRDVPHGSHRLVMHGTDLVECQQIAGPPVAWLQRLPVDPFGGGSVADDLHVLLEFFRSDRTAFVKELANLADDESVSLDRCRMVRLLVPQPLPDRFGLDGAWEAADPST
ncbi:MAG: hypothetical protein QM621_08710 [Aeromicrobium sp.]|uniref:hypothetical protein n=1 Tax=Aeromicrobium sp. TaxID=1871063 RepID=UPI0039E269FC